MNQAPKINQPREAYAASDEKTARQTASPLLLLIRAAGGPRQWAGKTTRALRTLLTLANRREVRRRLQRLQSLGYIEQAPTPLQLTLGGVDMLRYFISPGAKDYYQTRGINFSFHQVLRVFDDPVSMIDPVGILSERDTIIGHILQVVHANPAYDCQLLEMFPDGLDALEAQTRQMLNGTHPRATTIGAIVEDPAYHARLLDYIARFRQDRGTPELRRRAGQARESREFVLAEETFGTLPGAMRYMRRLPTTPRAAWRHFRNHPTIPEQLCDPAVVQLVRQDFGGA